MNYSEIIEKEPEIPASENTAEFKMKRLDIVLADDDEDDCMMFEETLKEFLPSAQLTKVIDGEQLMKLLEIRKGRLPDVVFLDINMPRKNGIECLKLIRGNNNFKDLLVIMYTTSGEIGIVNLTYQIGANHFICKPSELSIIRNKIKSAIGYVSEYFSFDNAEDSSKCKRRNFIITAD